MFGSESSTDYFKDWSLVEYYCEGNEIKSETYERPYGCKDGACIKD